jgi:hypothetical protein
MQGIANTVCCMACAEGWTGGRCAGVALQVLAQLLLLHADD